MASFKSLPIELLIHIAESVEGLAAVSRLARTCRRLHQIADPVLHRRASQNIKILMKAAKRDDPDVINRILAHQAPPRRIVDPHFLDVCFYEALKDGSFKTANALLEAGADVIYSCDSPRRSRRAETNAWLAREYPLQIGSLALAARSRYHLTYWYGYPPMYASEVDFWKWKRRAMEKITHRLKLAFHPGEPGRDPQASFLEYQRELDLALTEAANADAHATAAMDFLIREGAEVNARVYAQFCGQAWRNALDEEVPGLFRAKVEFLLERGVEPAAVRWFEGVQKPIQFFLAKMYRGMQFSDGRSFIPRALGFMDLLERLGCLRWPRVRFAAKRGKGGRAPGIEEVDAGVAGARELELIFADGSERLEALREALWRHICRKQGQKVVEVEAGDGKLQQDVSNAESLPKPIVRLQELYNVWAVESNSITMSQGLSH